MPTEKRAGKNLVSMVSGALAAMLVCANAHAVEPKLTVTTDPGSDPESVTQAPDGSLILGSAAKPVIYRAAKGETKAKVFIDVSATEGNVSFLGVLADAPTNTLWACQIIGTGKNRHSILRSFDLASGAPKLKWPLPGEINLCNDFVVGPDKALYVSDTFASKIFRLKPGATEPELLIEDRTLDGIDGIAFLGNELYVNNVISNNLYRIPLDAAGKAGAPVQIWPDKPIKGPDGMRAANGKLYLTENKNGRASMVTVNGDQATVVPIMEGLTRPTAIEPAGDILWVGDRAKDVAFAIPMPK
jgi:streptogramin lyase